MPHPLQPCQTILFADIAGSTRLYDQMGDQRALALITHCLNLLIARTHACQGTVIKTIGDEVMCIFQLADRAVRAAVSMHEEVSVDPQLSALHIQLRIGLHHGPVILESGDVYGDAVNVAARMVAQAKGGQIIITGATLGMLAADHRKAARLVDQTRVKGKPDPIEIYELAWGQPGEMTMITSFPGSRPGGAARAATSLTLHYRQRSWTLSQSRPLISMGRDAANDIVINDPGVSRLHACIELRKDRFILVDQSTNGTYLMAADGQGPLVRRDEIVLPEKGLIGLGEKPIADSPTAIRFERL